MSEITMPRLSDTMEEGTLSQWLKHPGDTIAEGEIIAEIETDKATMEIEAYEAGTLQEILVQEGETVPIGTPIAVVGTGQGDGQAAAPSQDASPAAAPAEQVTPQPPDSVHRATAQEPPGRVAAVGTGPAAPAAPGTEDGKVKASPVARAMARERGLDLHQVPGSGPGGRIVRADVEGFTPAGPAPSAAQPQVKPPPAAPPAPAGAAAPAVPVPSGADVEEVPLGNIRRVTAKRLVTSMQSARHFYLTTQVRADALLRFRGDLNEQLASAGVPKVSINDLVVKACATAIAANPVVNVSFADDKLLRYKRVNIGVAVAVEAGLIVPVVKDADRISLTHLAAETRRLVDKARAGQLALDEFTGGTFTVTNLGMYGVEHFTAIINPPEAAILAVGATTPQPVVDHGELSVAQTMRLTLGIDHRALDGATGAQFLQQVKNLLEEPLRILA